MNEFCVINHFAKNHQESYKEYDMHLIKIVISGRLVQL